MERKKNALAHVCCNLPKELKKRVVIRAAEDETSQTNLIIAALEKYLAS